MNKQSRIAVAVILIATAIYFVQANKKEPEQVAASPASVAPVVEAPKTPERTGPGPRDFLVAKVKLDPALISRITTDLVEVKTIPDNIPVAEPALVMKSYEQVEGKVLIAQVEQGEILLRSRFADARNEAVQKKLRDIIPTGWRAIALDVDAITGTTGFINQGDIVDVCATYTSGGRQLTRIIIQNVEVLARGTEYRSSQTRTADRMIRGDGGGGILFTLKVKPEMAVKLAHIIDERGFNRFRLILKNRDDKQELRSRGVLLREVLTDVTRPALKKGEVDNEQPPEIEIMRGAAILRESAEEQNAGPPELASARGQPGGDQASLPGQPQQLPGSAPQDLLNQVRPISQNPDQR